MEKNGGAGGGARREMHSDKGNLPKPCRGFTSLLYQEWQSLYQTSNAGSTVENISL